MGDGQFPAAFFLLVMIFLVGIEGNALFIFSPSGILASSGDSNRLLLYFRRPSLFGAGSGM